jgi:hypothetical protein
LSSSEAVFEEIIQKPNLSVVADQDAVVCDGW